MCLYIFIYASHISEIKFFLFFFPQICFDIHRPIDEIRFRVLTAYVRDISIESVTSKLNLPRLSCHSLRDSFHSALARYGGINLYVPTMPAIKYDGTRVIALNSL